MLADGDEGRRGDEVALVLGEVQLHAPVLLRVEGVPHVLEVRQRAPGEPVAFGGFEVELVEAREVVAGAEPHLDAHLGGLLDVASPQLVHALEQLVFAFLRAVGVAKRELEIELRLACREPLAGLIGDPPALLQRAQRPGAFEGRLVGGGLRELGDLIVGDGALDSGGAPATVHHRRPDTHRERAVVLSVGDQCVEMFCEVGAFPVEHGPLREVGQVATQLRQLAIQNECGAGELVAVEEADGLTSPLGLHLGPGRGLQKRRGPPLYDELEHTGCGHGTNLDAHVSQCTYSALRERRATSAGSGLVELHRFLPVLGPKCTLRVVG